MEPEDSLPHSQVPTTCPYPEPHWSSTHSYFLNDQPNIILPSTPVSSTKTNLYLANSLAAAVSEPALYRLLTFQVPDLTSIISIASVVPKYQSRSEAFVNYS